MKLEYVLLRGMYILYKQDRSYKSSFWGDVIKTLTFKRSVENSSRRERKARSEDGRTS